MEFPAIDFASVLTGFQSRERCQIIDNRSEFSDMSGEAVSLKSLRGKWAIYIFSLASAIRANAALAVGVIPAAVATADFGGAKFPGNIVELSCCLADPGAADFLRGVALIGLCVGIQKGMGGTSFTMRHRFALRPANLDAIRTLRLLWGGFAGQWWRDVNHGKTIRAASSG